MADLTLYTNPMSRGRIAQWMCEETGADYDVNVLDISGAPQAPAYLAINPMSKVPAIRHRDVVVTEAAAICAYLADAFPEAGLAPDSRSPDRGPYYRWLFFAAGPIEQAVTHRALQVDVPKDREVMVGYGTMERVLDTLEALLDGTDFVAGGRFSAADLYLVAQLGWGMQFGTIEARPAFRTNVDRLDARPAAMRVKAADDALLAPPSP